MARLENRIDRLEQARPGADYVVAVVLGDEDEEAAIERCCRDNGITRQQFDAAQHRSILRVEFVRPGG